jgi:outer membrane protein assembly factor BamB
MPVMGEGNPNETGPIPDGRRHRRIRWWPALVIAFLAALAILYVRGFRENSHQERNLQTLTITVVAFVLLLTWVALLSRMRWRLRCLVLGGVFAVIGSLAAMFEIRGVTGDLLPILGFRWKRPANSPGARKPGKPGAASIAGQIPERTHDFPQFMGPHRNGTLTNGPRLARDWSHPPPAQLWRQPIGAGWSGFAVAGSRAVTLEQRGEDECVVCYELATGRELWVHADRARYFTTIAGEGPRTTPTIAGGRVVTLGATGILNCLELGTGRVFWSTNIITGNQSRAGEWGVAGSPLVVGEWAVVNPGGEADRSLVAYRLETGEFAWGGGRDGAGYSSPCEATLGGVPQILIFNHHAIFGHDPTTGKVLWEHPWPSAHPHVALPVVVPGDRVLVSSGYGTGSELLQIGRDAAGPFTVKRLWKTNRLKAKFNNPITRGGFVYGLDDGILACVELETGELKWKDGRYGHGQFILAGDLLLLTAESGEVALIDPVPTERRELARFRALNGKTWNPPALAGDLLVIRNDQEAACYQLPIAR